MLRQACPERRRRAQHERKRVLWHLRDEGSANTFWPFLVPPPSRVISTSPSDIDAIPRTEVDAVFGHTLADRFYVGMGAQPLFESALLRNPASFLA